MANTSTAKIAKQKFHREPKEKTTEPSVDILSHEGMKRGGHAKKMALGGQYMASPMPRRRAMPPALLMRKKGGEVESHKEHEAEMHEMHKIEKELKHHERMPAKKAHHGLKKGGIYNPQIGGLLGEGMPHHKGKTGAGVEGPGFKHGGKIHHISGHPEGSHKHHIHMAKHHAEKHAEGGSAHHKKMHEHHKHMAKMCKGGKYSEGGTMPMVTHGGEHLKHGGRKHAKGGSITALAKEGDRFQTEGTLKPKVNVKDKVVTAKQAKGFHTKTGGIELEGYKRGGKSHKYAKGGTISDNVAYSHLDNMQDGSKRHTKAGKTGEIHQAPAGYKKGGHVKHHAHGGHVAHHTTHGHHDAGHTHMHHHVSGHEHGHEKMTNHTMKKGGSAHKKHHKNY